MLKCSRKGNNCVFGLCQQTRKIQCMYLAFQNLEISSKKSTVIRKVKAEYEWCFSWLKCDFIGAADAIKGTFARNSRNNVFRIKQTTTKVLPNIFRGSEVTKKVRLMFWRPKESWKINVTLLAVINKEIRCAGFI